MKFKTTTYSLVILALATSGCASVGNETLRAETEISVQGKLLEGKTTKSQTKSLFGSPLKTAFTDGGLEMWTYELSNVSADAISYIPIVNLFGGTASGKKKELVVLFDSSGVIKRFAMNESDVTQKTGVFNN